MARKPKSDKPRNDDLRHDDAEFNPQVEPKNSKAWLNLIRESEDAFEDWNARCDNIDKQFASLERLSRNTRDKEFQMFWANCEVLKPAIYAKAPIPVVTSKFKDRMPVYQAAAEVMERCCVVAFDLTRINDLMLLVRDDLSMNSRGVAWCRYESSDGDGEYDTERVCVDFKDRRDFLHSISRNWREVTWVAAASYLTRGEARKRFHATSGDAYQQAEYRVDREAKNVGGADNRERAKFWEVWDKSNKRVVWVSEGCEDILDEDDPHLKLQNYFPCPKPAYGTVQRRSLVPVPDVLQYRDQLDEINLLTARIHALSDAIEAKGFYPAGGSELAEAIGTAVATHTPGRMLIPIKNWAAFGGTKDVIIWLPIDMIAQTITALVALRKQVIEDIYQIMGLSDIMRGATDPNETLGAQQLKTQYGSTRIRDKQAEMVRLARDTVEIFSEIITQKFDPTTIVEMSQTQLPTQKMQQQKAMQIQQQAQQLIQQAQQAQQMQAQQQQQQLPPPGGMPQDIGSPQDVKQVTERQTADPMDQIQTQLQQLQNQYHKLQEEPTLDQVLYFLKDGKKKSFVLDIETDSTIMQDENAEKERRTEFTQVLGNLLPQLAQMMTGEPQTAEFCGEVLKFATAPFRAGRALEAQIDALVELMKKKGEQGQGEDPATAQNRIALQIEQMKDATMKEKNKAEALLKAKEIEQKDTHKRWELENERQIKAAEIRAKQADAGVKGEVQNQKLMENRESHQAHMLEKSQDMDLARQKAAMVAQQHAAKQQDMANRANERQMSAIARPPANRRPV
jgi:hypothetical protein